MTEAKEGEGMGCAVLSGTSCSVALCLSWIRHDMVWGTPVARQRIPSGRDLFESLRLLFLSQVGGFCSKAGKNFHSSFFLSAFAPFWRSFLLEVQPSSVVTGVKEKKKKLGRLKMVLLFLLKMLPWTSRFLRQILALQPGYYLWCDLCKTQSIVNKECCNRISLREAMFCHFTTNSAGDHTQVISHSEFTTVTRHILGLLFIYAFLTFLFFLSFLSFHLFFSFFSAYFRIMFCRFIPCCHQHFRLFFGIDTSLLVRCIFFWLWF